MASRAEIQEIIIEKLDAIYATRHDKLKEPKAFARAVAAYFDAFREIEASQLEYAMLEIVRVYEGPFWPTPATIRKHFPLTSHHIASGLQWPPLDQPDRVWTAEEVFPHPIGQDALRANVGAQLLDNLNAKKWRRIEDASVRWLIEEREASNALVRDIKANPFPGAIALVNLFGAMMDREIRLANEWLGKTIRQTQPIDDPLAAF